MNIDTFGGRKVVMSAAVLAIGGAIDMYSKAGLSANMLQLLSVVLGAFCVGNGVEHVAAAMKKPEAVAATSAEVVYQAAPAVDLSGLQADIDGAKQAIAETKRATEATLTGVTYVVDYIQKSQKN